MFQQHKYILPNFTTLNFEVCLNTSFEDRQVWLIGLLIYNTLNVTNDLRIII